MASANVPYSTTRLVKYWEEIVNPDEAELDSELLFDPPIANGTQMATLVVTRTYRVPYKEAKESLKLSM